MVENFEPGIHQEWTERYGSYVKAAAAWRIGGLTSFALAMVSTSYALYQSTQAMIGLVAMAAKTGIRGRERNLVLSVGPSPAPNWLVS